MFAIKAKNITKDYRIYSRRGQKFSEWMTLNQKRYHDVKRALSDISFEIGMGECFGIIGDNGSGKSTILKILAGTSYATKGQTEVRGKVSYILDVSTGFNFHFSGRENIYTKCALLGMSPKEIAESYDSIIAFAGLEERINHPIKTYSTGMVMRLGFSVAIHVPFDILIVDEVLAVGDYVFQQNCIRAIREIIASGKTVIITSHALADISSFCDRILLLEDGKMIQTGETDQVIQSYLELCECKFSAIENTVSGDSVLGTCQNRIGNVRIGDVQFQDLEGRAIDAVASGQGLRIAFGFDVDSPIENPCMRFEFLRNDGLLVMGANSHQQNVNFKQLHGSYRLNIDFDEFALLEGDYFLNIGIWPDEMQSYAAKSPFDIHEFRHKITVHSGRTDGGGLVRTKSRWTVNKLMETE